MVVVLLQVLVGERRVYVHIQLPESLTNASFWLVTNIEADRFPPPLNPTLQKRSL